MSRVSIVLLALILSSCADTLDTEGSGKVSSVSQPLPTASDSPSTPSELELTLCLAMREELRNSPAAEEIPEGLTGDALGLWTVDNQQRAIAFEQQLIARLARENSVTTDEVSAAYVEFPSKYGRMCGL